MAKILAPVLDDGLVAVEAACAEALVKSVSSADAIINIVSRQRDPAPPITIMLPGALTLRRAPLTDCAYDSLRRIRPMERIRECIDIPDMMESLNLFGIRSAFEIVAAAIKQRHEPQRLAGALLKAEIDEKLARSSSTR